MGPTFYTARGLQGALEFPQVGLVWSVSGKEVLCGVRNGCLHGQLAVTLCGVIVTLDVILESGFVAVG